MDRRPLGKADLNVSVLGLGAGRLGDDEVPEDAVSELLNTALDAGINFIDTAPSYGASEERIGRHLQHRRDDFLLATKGGYGVPGVPDWTPEVIAPGIEQSLSRMKTDRIDVFQLHSCPREVAMRDDMLAALEKAKDTGKVRFTGYSGEGEALAWAVRSGKFDAVQCSVNLFDQKNLEYVVPAGAHHGVGVIAKRSLGNAVWRHAAWPKGEDADYWMRMQAMQLDVGELEWAEIALRFSAFTPGVSTALVGTMRPDHLEDSVAAVAKGPLPEETRLRIHAAFQSKDRGWSSKV